MLNSTLFEILRTFDKEELKKFEDLLNSPFYNKNSNAIKLFKTIKKYFPELNSPDLKRDNLWKELYPEKEFNYGVMKNLVYELTRLSYKMMELQSYESKLIEKEFYLLENIIYRSSEKLFNTQYKLIENILNNGDKFYEGYFKHLSELKFLKYDYIYRNKSLTKEKSLAIDISEFKVYHNLISLFKSYGTVVGFFYRNNFKKELNLIEVYLDNLNIELILKSVQKISEERYFIILVYYKMYLALRFNDSSKNYFEFKNLLTEKDKCFHVNEKRILYNFLETALTVNSEINASGRDYFEIDRLRSEKGILIDSKNNISFNEFTNIVKTASSLKEISFIENFVKTNHIYIPATVREYAVNYSMAYLYNLKKDYDKSIEMINSFLMDNYECKVDLKTLQIRNYFEKSDFVTIGFLIDSFKHYLTSEAVQDIYITAYQNFSKYLLRLIKIKENQDISKLTIIKKEILNDQVALTYWLLEKIEELESTIRF